MKIVDSGDFFELHIKSSISDNIVTVNGKSYVYKRLVIPKILIDYFSEDLSGNVKYLYLYFLENQVFLSSEKISDIKFSKRKVMKINHKNSFFINLNERSLEKHNISLGNNVLFVVGKNNLLNSSGNISIELRF